MNILLVYLGKLISFFTKLLNLGAGATWPGHVVLKLNKNFISHYEKKLKHGSIVISGTNGKTTTALLVSSILAQTDFKVLHNTSGANMLNGLASSFIKNISILGQLKANIAVLEVDEANLPQVLKILNPKTVLLLNLSRDQLDRYGEVTITLEKWATGLNKLSSQTNLVINKDDQRLIKLTNSFPGKIYYFSLNNKILWPLPLLGEFNKLNCLAAIQAAKILQIPDKTIKKALRQFKPAFGRGEEFKIKGRIVKIILAKNPASFNTNLKMIQQYLKATATILFVLNDNIPDGRDVSWIYDIDSTALKNVCANRKIIISGSRHYDMALRLKYAGIDCQKFWHSNDLEKMIDTMIQQTDRQELCLILPTYSAMLDSRKILCGRKIL